MRFPSFSLLWAIAFVVGTAAPASGQALRAVSGRVLAAEDGAPLRGVAARVIGTDIIAVSDEAGRFVLQNVPRLPTVVTFQRFGLIDDTLALSADQDTLVAYLAAEAVRIEDITAEAAAPARHRFEETAQTSTVTLDAADIRDAPAVLEADVIRTVQLLPGTVARNDYTTGFNVRGGESDQNLILLDGVPIFNPTHLGGLFSTFDAAAVDRVDFMTGAFPAGYGGRLSSVMDVTLRRGSSERTTVRGQLSLLSAKLLVDGPVGETDATYLIGGRRTYADAVVGAVSKATLPYYFADAVAKVTVPVGDARISAMAYWGTDVLDWPWLEDEPGRDGVDLEFNWGNQLFGVTVEKPFGDRILSLHVSRSAFAAGLGLEPDLFRLDNTVRLWSGRWSLALSPDATHDVRIGGGVEDYAIAYDIRSNSLNVDFFSRTYQPRIWFAFVDDQWHPLTWLLVRPGVRFERVEGRGFTSFAPRVSMKVFVDDDLALVGSAGRYYQSIHSLLDHDIPVALFDVWVGADEFLPVARSDHLVFGFEKWFGASYSISLEGYRKWFRNLVIRNLEQDFKLAGDEFLTADGDAWGADLMVRKYGAKLHGWLAYSFSKTSRVAAGEEFTPAHDRRHTLDIVLRADGPLGSTMGVRWGFGSPLPYTDFVGEWRHREYNAIIHAFEDFENEPIPATRRNRARYPSYHRLDVSLRWEVNKWGGILRPYFQVANIYNRRNVFVYTYHYDDRPATRTGISQLPLLPSFGLEFVF